MATSDQQLCSNYNAAMTRIEEIFKSEAVNPLFFPEIVEKIFKYLTEDDIRKHAQLVCKVWYTSARWELELRKTPLAALR